MHMMNHDTLGGQKWRSLHTDNFSAPYGSKSAIYGREDYKYGGFSIIKRGYCGPSGRKQLFSGCQFPGRWPGPSNVRPKALIKIT